MGKEADISNLKTRRAAAKGYITRIKNFVEQNEKTITAEELECRLSLLERYFQQILILQDNIEMEDPDQGSQRDEIENHYCSTKAKILTLMHKLGVKSTQGNSSFTDTINNSVVVSTANSAQLPKLRLPRFKGEYTEYMSFINSFKTLVDSCQELSTVQKFQHLLTCLEGQALELIEGLEMTDDNYSQALEMLASRYDNKCIIFQAHVRHLFEVPLVTKGQAAQLRTLTDRVNVHLKALKSLGTAEDILNTMVLHIVKGKLDSDSYTKWEESLNFERVPTWEECATFLNKRCQQLESRSCLSSGAHPSVSARTAGKVSHRSSTSLVVPKSNCIFCQRNNHLLSKCWKFQKLNVAERYREAKKLELCLNCLNKGHFIEACTSPRCKVCGEPHHSLLHRYTGTGVNGQQSSLLTASTPTNGETYDSITTLFQTSLHNSTSNEYSDQVILATAIVQIKNKFGEFVLARAVLDSGSTLNFITEDLLQKLQLKGYRAERTISGIAEISSMAQFKTNTIIKSRFNHVEVELDAWVLPRITGSQPERRVNVNDWTCLNHICLADPQFNVPKKIDLLLGAEITLGALIEGKLRSSVDHPILQNTDFGWVVGGRYRVQPRAECSLTASGPSSVVEENLSSLVEQFWKIEDIENKRLDWTQEQMECEKHFCKTVSRTNDGRFILKLPFKADASLLGGSFEIAKRRMLALEHKLNRDSDLKTQYIQFMREYEALGHMQASPLDNSSIRYFIPHHAILRPESSSTKLRAVFDASCKTTSNISLNDLLMCGPTVQSDLFSIILRFRSHKYALVADIPKMYRQIWIAEEDWIYQAILWRESPSLPLKTFLLKTYGTSSAPYQASRCLNRLAENNLKQYPIGSQSIKSDMYMDDLVTGADTCEQLMQIKVEVETILAQAKFQLKKWFSNDEEFRHSIDENDMNKPLRVNHADIIKTLGIIWDPFEDQFRFNWTFNHHSSEATKRGVLSDLASLFDPLGLLNPVIVLGKMFMQELWTMQLEWDQPLPSNLAAQWVKFRSQLLKVKKIRIPRYIYSNTTTLFASELHGFADASCRAYGGCFYIRCISLSGKISTYLICAKSRVAPLKSLTLPRLELCAAVLLARLYKATRPIFGSLSKVYFWTDSEIVLHWVHGHPSTWSTFISHRVAEIQEITLKDGNWRHVSSKLNPADIISRGATVDELVESMWFSGPEFLIHPEESWPPIKVINQSTSNIPEKRRIKTVLVAPNTNGDIITHHKLVNNFAKLRRIYAYVIRFYKIVSEKRFGRSYPHRKELTPGELEEAVLRSVFVIQRRAFAVEINSLQKTEQISQKSFIKSLSPFLDNNTPNLLRVGGRLQNGSMPYSVKHPILLPKDNAFVISYATHLHQKSLHAGSQALVALLRQKFWVVNAKSLANWVVRRCIHCFHYRPKIHQQIMGQLPAIRLQSTRAFNHAGVDFCGPFWTTVKLRGNKRHKSYIAVFICFASKATHLEVVSDLSSDAFVAALKRFVGRRGICSTLSCDNATNFVGAKTRMEEFRKKFYTEQHRKQITEFCSEIGIDFKFIPPRSPHFGGLWEAAVKSAKYHLVRTIGSAALTFEELGTVAVQIEAMLNSRPISPMSSDPNDDSALTPGHFLVNGPLKSIPEPDVTERKLSLLNRWQLLSSIQQHFWKRWSREYVPQLQLQQKYKWTTSSPDIKQNMLVLVADEQLPPQYWLLGRIERTLLGPDGRIRVVDIKTKKGIIRRAVNKIAPLPLY